jgi:hypothetical protein
MNPDLLHGVGRNVCSEAFEENFRLHLQGNVLVQVDAEVISIQSTDSPLPVIQTSA